MRRVYFVTEGPHDVEALGRLLSTLGAKRVKNISDLDPFWVRLVPRTFPHEGDLLRRVPVPIFFQSEQFSVGVHSAIGISQIPRVTRASLAVLSHQVIQRSAAVGGTAGG
jgi:ABC-type transporter Mla MlaB component